MQIDEFDNGYAEGYENGYNGTNDKPLDNNESIIFQTGFNIGHINGIYNAKKDGFIIGFCITYYIKHFRQNFHLHKIMTNPIIRHNILLGKKIANNTKNPSSKGRDSTKVKMLDVGKNCEINLWATLSNCCYKFNDKIYAFNTQNYYNLGCSDIHNNDVQCNWNGQENVIHIEVKNRLSAATWTSCSVIYDDYKYTISSKSSQPKVVQEIYGSYLNMDIIQKFNEQYLHKKTWTEIKNSLNEEIKNRINLVNSKHEESKLTENSAQDFIESKYFKFMQNKYYDYDICSISEGNLIIVSFTIDKSEIDIISKIYSSKGCQYVYIESDGLFHTGSDPCDFGVPYFQSTHKFVLRISSKGIAITFQPDELINESKYGFIPGKCFPNNLIFDMNLIRKINAKPTIKIYQKPPKLHCKGITKLQRRICNNSPLSVTKSDDDSSSDSDTDSDNDDNTGI